LLLRVAALGRLGLHRVGGPVGLARLDDARPAPAALLHDHGHPPDRGAGAPQPRRGLPALPAGDLRLRALVPQEALTAPRFRTTPVLRCADNRTCTAEPPGGALHRS